MSFFVPRGPTIPGSVVFRTLTSSIDTDKIIMNDGKLTKLSEPTNPSDAATKHYVDSRSVDNLTGPISSLNGVSSITSQTGTGTTFVMNTGPTIVGINAGDTIISNVSTPISGTDAANKDYVDASSTNNLSGPISSINGVSSITSKTGTGTTFVMNNNPTLITPNIGSATGTSLNISGNISGNQLVSTVLTGASPFTVSSSTQVPNLRASAAVISDTVTTNANLSGPISSLGNASYITSQSGSGSTFVMNNTPTLITPNIGVATGTSLGVSGLIECDHLRSTVPTGTAPFIVSSTTKVINLRSSTADNSDTVTTNANLTGPIMSVGNVTSINSKTGTGSTFVMNTSPTILNLSGGNTIISNISTPVSSTDASNKAYVDSLTTLPQYTATVQKNPGPGEFSTIESALASITTSSITQPWVVEVGPGIYDENQLIIPSYVSVKGSAINPTMVRPIVPNQYLFIMRSNTDVSFMSLKGISGSVSPGPGAGFAAIYCEDVEDFAQIHKVSIYDFDIAIDNYSNVTFSNLYVEYTDVNGDYSYGVRNRTNSSLEAFCVLEDFFSFPSTSVIKTSILNDGFGSRLVISGTTLYGGSGMTGIVSKNGGEILMGSVIVKDFSNGGLISENTGAGANIKIDGSTFDNCTPDFSINNIGTTGYFFGNSPRNKHSIINGSSFFIAGQDSNIVNVAKRGGDYTSIKTAVDSLTAASTSNIFLVKIGPGVFVEDTITLRPGIFIFGYYLNATTIVASNPNNTVIVVSDFAYVRDVFVTGATGITGIAMSFQGTIGLGTLIRDCAFGNNTTNVKVFGNTVPTLLVIDRCSILGNCTECFVVTNNPGIPTRITVDNVFYRDLITPVSTNFLRASGVDVTVNIVSILLLVATVSGSKAFNINDGVDLKITGTSITGFDTAIYVPTGSTNACTINGSGVLINNSGTNDIYIGSDNTLGAWVGEVLYSKTVIPTNSPFYISGKDATIINVQKKGGDFTSIVTALASITDNTTFKRYTIIIGSGVYIESEIMMKPYVSVYGNGRSTVVAPVATNHHIIRGVDNVELGNMILTGAGTGYAAVYQETATGVSNSALICRNILFGANDINVWAYGNVGQAHIILFDSKYGGFSQFNYGFRATNNNNSVASDIIIMGATSQNFTSPMPAYIGYASGTNCAISANSFNAEYDGVVEAGTYGFKVDNGGKIRLLSAMIKGFDTAIASINSGSTPAILAAGCTITDCNTDVNIGHTSTTGSIDISASSSKTIVNGTPPISLFFVDPSDKGIAFSGPFLYSENDFNKLADISNLIVNTPTMGLMSGGGLSISSGLTASLAPGTGYNETVGDVLNYQSWSSLTLLLPANSNSYVFINSNGIFTYAASYPNSVQNIILGLVSTDATNIIYIQKTPLSAHHWSNTAASMLKDAFGIVYVSGSTVAEFGSLQLTVTQGSYYFSTNHFLPGGQSPATFTIYYRSATPGIYTSIPAQTTVPNGFYDSGSGTLVSLTASFYTKHLLVLLGGPSEVYALIYGQAEYSTSGDAEAAGLPIVPSFVKDSFVKVSSIVVRQGTTNIAAFVDERPRIGFANSTTAGAITVHANLLGLGANDHPQYLLVDGSAPGMTGDLWLNGNNITGVNLLNSINISLHGARHGINSSDPLPTPTLASGISDISGTAGSIGIGNNIPRADHVHFHGNLGGGALHASVIAAGASGFMTGTDKTKLDGIQTGATNTTASNITPLSVTKAAASAGVSVEVSRVDHKHDISTASPVASLLTSSTNSEGSATSLARSDHTHTIASDVPVLLTPDQTIAIGNSTAFSRADHIHNIPTAIAAGLTATSVNQQGASSSFSRSNHIHSIASGVPSNQTIAVTLATGTSTNFARADHIHTFSTAAPVNIGILNTEGTGVSFARADHVHAHGAQTDGTLHAVVIASGASGFMTGTDKTKLDGIASGATNTSLTNTAPVNVDKSADSVGVSVEVARSDHKHNISTAIASGLSATSTNAEGVATSLARSDHTHAIASGVPSNQTIAVALDTGTSINFARADHIHTFSTAAPVAISTSNVIGTSTSFARADHVHDHGTQTGPTNHAVATTTNNGFLASTDKVKLNIIGNHTEVSASATQLINTVSTTPSVITGMTVSPNIGTHIVNFNANYTSIATSITQQTADDLLTASNALSALTQTGTHGLTYGAETITPGVYGITGAGSITTAITVTLDGQGNPNSMFVFRITAAFTTGASCIVALINGAQSTNVFWVANDAIALGASTTIVGTLLSKTGAVSTGAGCIINGRLASLSGALSISASAVTKPSAASQIALGLVDSFAMFTRAGGLTAAGVCTVNGNIGTNDAGAITGFESSTVNGNFYTPTSIVSSLTFGIYNNGVLVANSGRDIITSFNNTSVISLFAVVPVTTGQITARVLLNAGSVTINNRIISTLQINT